MKVALGVAMVLSLYGAAAWFMAQVSGWKPVLIIFGIAILVVAWALVGAWLITTGMGWQ